MVAEIRRESLSADPTAKDFSCDRNDGIAAAIMCVSTQ
jgi:hypothetical protein